MSTKVDDSKFQVIVGVVRGMHSRRTC